MGHGQKVPPVPFSPASPGLARPAAACGQPCCSHAPACWARLHAGATNSPTTADRARAAPPASQASGRHRLRDAGAPGARGHAAGARLASPCARALHAAMRMDKDRSHAPASPAPAQALEKFNIEKDIAAFIKKEFDKKYNPTWHCIVGRNFGAR